MQIDNTFVFIVNILGVIAFAISGSTASISKGLDIVGVIVLSVITSLFGGVIRDMILGVTPPNFFVNPEYFIYIGEAALIGVICFVVAYMNKKNDNLLAKTAKSKILYITDAVGLGVFAVSGVDIAIRAGYSAFPLVCIFAGVITGVGGSMTRDIILGEIPILFKKYIYITPAVLGATVYYLLYNVIPEVVAYILGVIIITGIRIMAIFFKWNLPTIHENPATNLHIGDEDHKQ